MNIEEKIKTAKVFSLRVYKRGDWNDERLSIDLDISSSPEKVIGEAIGYYAKKYPDCDISVSDTFSAGYAFYSLENGQFENHKINYKINKDIDASLIEKNVLKVMTDGKNIESYRPQNVRDCLYVSPKRNGIPYCFYASQKIGATTFGYDRCFREEEYGDQYWIPETKSKMFNDKISYEMAYFYLNVHENQKHISEVLHLMPEEFRPIVLQVKKGEQFATYDVKIQIGNDLLSDTLKYDTTSIEEYGDPPDAEIVGDEWKKYMFDHVIKNRDEFKFTFKPEYEKFIGKKIMAYENTYQFSTATQVAPKGTFVGFICNINKNNVSLYAPKNPLGYQNFEISFNDFMLWKLHGQYGLKTVTQVEKKRYGSHWKKTKENILFSDKNLSKKSVPAENNLIKKEDQEIS